MQVFIKQEVISYRTRTIEVEDDSTTEDIQEMIEGYGYEDSDDETLDEIVVKTNGFATDADEDYEDGCDPEDLESWVDCEIMQTEG